MFKFFDIFLGSSQKFNHFLPDFKTESSAIDKRAARVFVTIRLSCSIQCKWNTYVVHCRYNFLVSIDSWITLLMICFIVTSLSFS